MIQDFKRVINAFEETTKNHMLTVLVDSDVNRIMRFGHKDGSSVLCVKVMQTEGEIAYVGDMGDFCFSNHNADMLAWFKGNTSLQYINEKCRAGNTEEYDEKKARQWVEADVLDYCEQNFNDYIDGDEVKDEEYQAKKLAWIDSLTEDVISEIDFENQYTFHSSINDLEININKWMAYTVYDVHDLINSKQYTHSFVWCVLAMNKIAELYFSGDYISEVPDDV